ncbi:MAG: hypothetical protein Q4D96_14245 [Propionibacteriaceae bacterium]|nr:hypothetical protein [Propionibacteriaceae bacterium]
MIFFLLLALGCAVATVGAGLWGNLLGGYRAGDFSAGNSEFIEMPTKFADTFAVDPAEGWLVKMYYKKEGAFCWVSNDMDRDPFPGPALKIQHTRGRLAEVIYSGRGARSLKLSYGEVLRHRKEEHSKFGHKNLILLPDRVIGGERAVGVSYRYESEGQHGVEEQYHVIRHDGLWTFTLHSGINRDVIDPDTYRVLDTFRWTGPFDEASVSPRPTPSPEPSPSESEG